MLSATPTTRSSPPVGEPGSRPTTSAANGGKPAPIPGWSGSPRTPSARPLPHSWTGKQTPKPPPLNSAMPANRSPPGTTSTSPTKHPTPPTCSTCLDPTCRQHERRTERKGPAPVAITALPARLHAHHTSRHLPGRLPNRATPEDLNHLPALTRITATGPQWLAPLDVFRLVRARSTVTEKSIQPPRRRRGRGFKSRHPDRDHGSDQRKRRSEP